MEHIYQNIHGWFGFENFYLDILKKFDDATFVEVGSWLGRSTSFLGVEILNQNKNIEFYCVDTWLGSETEQEHQNNSLVKNNTLFEQFLVNIDPIKNIIKPIQKTSIEASKLFEDKSIDFCFIDADHSYEHVKQDILNWYPKIKDGGILAGHDYPTWPGVKLAVEEFVNNSNINLNVHPEYCWWVSK